MSDRASTTPLLRWAGSKRACLPALRAQVPDSFCRYIEPFAGSACLYFDLAPHTAVLGDFNPHVINFYEQLRISPLEVHRAVAALPRGPEEYYRVRGWRNHELSAFERAVRFFYLNRNCFNGVYRTNRRGEFNVPHGRRTGSVPSEEAVLAAAKQLAGAALRSADFSELLRLAKHGDFVYVDPPYATTSRPVYGEYGYGSFDQSDEQRLLVALRQLTDAGVHVLLSYGDSRLTDQLGPDWRATRMVAARRVAGGLQHRRSSTEVLARNYD